MSSLNSKSDACAEQTPSSRSRWHPQSGQHLAVIAGEGQGWMAQVIASQVGAREQVYWVRLADGRRLVKLASELAELVGLEDSDWPSQGQSFG
jgi:hypothetical protein